MEADLYHTRIQIKRKKYYYLEKERELLGEGL
jgi:hypothetical protein